MLVFGILVSVLLVVAMWKILSKAGFSPWLSLLAAVPLVNLWLILYVAFADWPALEARDKEVDDEVQRLRTLLLDTWKEQQSGGSEHR